MFLKIKKIEYNFFNFFNKLFINKNLNFFLKNKNYKNIKFFIKKKPKLTKIVSLRAPKHFKVGRHHYQVLKQIFRIQFVKQTNFYFFKKIYLNKILFFLIKYLDNKQLTKPFAYNNTIKIKLELNETFELV